MQIRPSSALRNDYNAISELARKTGEPVFITNKGEGDGVFMSVEAFEEREKMFRHRDAIYAAELSRLSGEPVCSQSELDERMEALFNAAESGDRLPPAGAGGHGGNSQVPHQRSRPGLGAEDIRRYAPQARAAR